MVSYFFFIHSTFHSRKNMKTTIDTTANVVTRSSILNILKSQIEQGDEMAEEYVYDIEQIKACGWVESM